MTKEITKANILQEIQDKFKLRELAPEIFRFSEEVIPTYDIAGHLQSWRVDYFTRSIVSAPTAYTFFTVPQNEKWLIRGYNIVFMAAGAYTVTGAYIRRGAADYTIYLDMVAGQTASYAVNLPTPVVLGPNDLIAVYVDSYTSSANLRLYIDYMKEEIR